MKRVTGIGGVFFKVKDVAVSKEWYKRHLGIDTGGEAYRTFEWRSSENPAESGSTTWSLFPADTKYFGASEQSFMINYRVENLTALLEELRKEGVEVDDKVEEYEFGKFGWIMDPDGNRIELWGPAVGM